MVSEECISAAHSTGCPSTNTQRRCRAHNNRVNEHEYLSGVSNASHLPAKSKEHERGSLTAIKNNPERQYARGRYRLLPQLVGSYVRAAGVSGMGTAVRTGLLNQKIGAISLNTTSHPRAAIRAACLGVTAPVDS